MITLNREIRGSLLFDQEETLAQIKELTEQLKTHGQHLTNFAHQLSNNPDKVILTNAPGDLGNYPQDIRNGSASFAWDKIPEKEGIARLIFDLKQKQKSLKDIQQQLHQN